MSTHSDEVTAQTTYRYLRLALVVLVVLLAASVLVEWRATGWSCLQTSISGYWYTPARAVLVGTLVAVGVCLVVLKGSDDREDVLLNLAGMMAPVVAFVPTPDRGPCTSVPVPDGDTVAAIDNNVTALFVAGLLGVALTVAAVVRRRDRTRAQVVGTGVSVAVLAAGWAWFALDPGGFRSAAHYTAAVPMFVVFVAVVWLNARDLDRVRGRPAGMWLGLRTRYAAVAVLMIVLPALMFGWAWLFGWAHVLLGVEGVLIALFAVFWLIQTAELGDLSGRVRPAARASPDEPRAARPPAG